LNVGNELEWQNESHREENKLHVYEDTRDNMRSPSVFANVNDLDSSPLLNSELYNRVHPDLADNYG